MGLRMDVPVANPFYFLEGGGAQARAIRAHDWSASPLGPIESWSAALKVATGMMLTSSFPKCLAWGPDLITLYNDAFRPILGEKAEALGRPFSQVWSEAWAEIGPIAERALRGEATFIEDYPLTVERHGYPEQTHFTFCYSPIRDETGRIVGIMDTVIETTARVEAERQAEVLNRELAHRIRNLMAVVGSVADQTLKSADSPEDARAVLSHRLAAMGQAQVLLTSAARGDAPLKEVVRAALAPHVREDRIAMAGPPVNLTERQVLALALAINELATNAGKYGALSLPTGFVEISWTRGRKGNPESFEFRWEERGGPPVTTPERRGFGSFLIEQHVGGAFGGQAAIAFEPTGITYTINADALDRHG